MSEAWRRHDLNKVIRWGGGRRGLLAPSPAPALLPPPTSVGVQAPLPKLPSPPEDFGPVMSQAGCYGDVR